MQSPQVQQPGETSPQQDGSSPYPRENYFSSVSEEYDEERSPEDPTTHEHDTKSTGGRNNKNEWIAKGILRDGATFICPIALHEDPEKCPYDCETYQMTGECDHESANLHSSNDGVELTDPEVYPVESSFSPIPETTMQKKAPSTSRWRVNSEHGYVVFGGIIQDRPKEQLLDTVDDVIFSMDCTFLDREVQEARDLARRLKRSGDDRDVDILRKVVSKLIGFRDE